MNPSTPEPLRVGIVGTGGVSRFHHDGYRHAGARLLAIADANPAALEARRLEWDVPRAYASYEALLADPEIEAVSVCLPNALHHPATIAAANAGKHVLCEKPIALSLELAQQMIDAARDNGIVLQVGHHLRTNPYVEKARAILESGELGRLTFARFRQAHDWGGAASIRASFGSRAQAGGGTLLDNGCHLMDLARYLGGNVRSVHARTATLGFDVEVEDTSVCTLEFTSGALGTVEASWTATGWEEGFWLYGTRGALEYTNRTGAPTLRHAHRASPNTDWARPDEATYRFGGLDAHHRGVQAFLAAVRGERAVVCTGEDGREAVRLVLAAYESARAGRPVALGREAETAPTGG